MPLNALPIPPGVEFSTLVGPQVQEILINYNLERLDAMSAPIDKNLAWTYAGVGVTPGIGIVKVPIRFLSSQLFTPFLIGGQREYATVDVNAISVPTSPNQLNYRWAMVTDALGKMNLLGLKGDGTYEDFYGGTGLAQAMVVGGRFRRALTVADVTYRSVTSVANNLLASMLCFDGIPLFTNGVDSAPHRANPNNPTSGTFATLFQPQIANRVGFTGGAFDSDWLGQMLLAMTQVPHPSLPNMNMGLEVTDIIGPTWMKIPFWKAAVQNLQLQTATVSGTGVAAATTNPFSAKAVMEMGADKFIGAGGVAPYRMWTTSLLDSHPYFTNNPANLTNGPDGGPAHMAIAISASDPTHKWVELAANDKEFTPRVSFFGAGDPESQSTRTVRMLGDLDCGGRPGMPHFAMMFFGR